MSITIPPEQLVNNTDDFVTIAQKIQNIITFGGTKESYDALLKIVNDAEANNDTVKTNIVSTIGAPSLNTDAWSTINTNIQNSKNTLASKLGALGISASGTDTLNNLVNKVNKDVNLIPGNILSGKTIFGVTGNCSVGAIKTGTTVTISNGASIYFTSSTGSSGENYVTVTGLNFIPTYIKVYEPNGIQQCTEWTNAFPVTNDSNYTISVANSSGTKYKFKLDGTAAYVNSTGFRLPIMDSYNITYNWVAIKW